MYRTAVLVFALLFPSVAAAQRPCTTDARQVVNELYRHMLERQADAGSAQWVQQLESGRMTVRDVVRSIATSPEYTERFFYAESGESTQVRAIGRTLVPASSRTAARSRWPARVRARGPTERT
jgi:hypothetical protein